jgi:hypothetical protein
MYGTGEVLTARQRAVARIASSGERWSPQLTMQGRLFFLARTVHLPLIVLYSGGVRCFNHDRAL